MPTKANSALWLSKPTWLTATVSAGCFLGSEESASNTVRVVVWYWSASAVAASTFRTCATAQVLLTSQKRSSLLPSSQGPDEALEARADRGGLRGRRLCDVTGSQRRIVNELGHITFSQLEILFKCLEVRRIPYFPGTFLLETVWYKNTSKFSACHFYSFLNPKNAVPVKWQLQLKWMALQQFYNT